MNASDKYHEQIEDVRTQFASVLSDYKRYYVAYHKNPESDELANYYQSSKQQLKQLTRQLVELTQSIQQSTQQLNEAMMQTNADLAKHQEMNAKLEQLHHSLSLQGSDVMIDQAKTEYNNYYRHNVQIVLGILISGIFIAKTRLYETVSTINANPTTSV